MSKFKAEATVIRINALQDGLMENLHRAYQRRTAANKAAFMNYEITIEEMVARNRAAGTARDRRLHDIIGNVLHSTKIA